jgi:hypothetical protein
MKKRNLERLETGLNSVLKLKGVRFAYAVVKNLQLIQTEIKAFTAAIEPDDAYAEYDKKRIELCKKYADKDKNEKPVTLPIRKGSNIVRFIIKKAENKELFNAEMEVLNEEYKDAIEKRNGSVKEFEKILDGDCDVKLEMIDLKDIPADITGEQLVNINEMVKGFQLESEIGKEELELVKKTKDA